MKTDAQLERQTGGGARRALLAALALAVTAGPAQAHRQHHAVVTVAWSPSAARLEVAHQLHDHDLEDALVHAGHAADLTLESIDAQALAALYVADRFTLTTPDGAPIPLEILGVEIEDDTVWVYQEAALAAPPDEVCVINVVLFDLLDDQVNTVILDANREASGHAGSLTFKAEDGAAVQCLTFADRQPHGAWGSDG